MQQVQHPFAEMVLHAASLRYFRFGKVLIDLQYYLQYHLVTCSHHCCEQIHSLLSPNLSRSFIPARRQLQILEEKGVNGNYASMRVLNTPL